MQLDKLDLGIAAAVLRHHAEMSDLTANRLIEASPDIDDELRSAIIDLEEDRDIFSEIADKMSAMVAAAPDEELISE